MTAHKGDASIMKMISESNGIEQKLACVAPQLIQERQVHRYLMRN